MNGAKSILFYVFHSFLSRLYFFLPILVVWFLSLGFSQFQVTALLSVFFIAVTLSEIPTGIIADKIGHKYALVLCGLFQALGVFLLAYAHSLGLAILGEVFMGVGQAFYTGAKEAWLYNTLEENQLAPLYQKEYSQSKILEFVGMGLASLVGNYAYLHNHQLPFFLTAGAFLLAAVTGSLLPSPAKKAAPSLTIDLRHGFRQILKGSVKLKTLVIYNCGFFAASFVFLIALNQPYLLKAGVPLKYFGLVFLLFQSSAMMGSVIARSLPQHFLHRRIGLFLTLMALGLALGFSGLASLRHPLTFLLIAVLNLMWGLFLPTSSHALNQLIPSETRATVISTQDFLQHFSFVILSLFLGRLTDHWGIYSTVALLSALSLLTSLLAFRLHLQSPE